MTKKKRSVENTVKIRTFAETVDGNIAVKKKSVYGILKRFDLVQSPAFNMISASDKFKRPTKRVNELWQTDFAYFKIIGWGWMIIPATF